MRRVAGALSTCKLQVKRWVDGLLIASKISERPAVPNSKKPSKERRSDCPIAGALDILGDRWSLVIVRDIVFRGFREYGHFLEAGEGISTNILAERLERLTCAGILVRAEHPTNGKKYVYRLTEKGVDLVPTLIELALWGSRYVPDNVAPPEVVHQMRTGREKMIRQLRDALLTELRQSMKQK
jgi:DNA-binding HxlR family transcriptional regulator